MNHKGPSICEIYMPSEQEFIPKVKGVVKNDGCVFAPPLEEMSPILQMSDIKRIMKNDISKKSQLIIRPSEKQ
jgi:acetolactate synthase-1/2/3 large subunit